MKERRMERLVLLPFSIGCVSESSVAVGVDQPRVIPTTKLHAKPHKSSETTTTKRKEEEDRESSSSIAESMKSTSSFKFLPLSKLLKSFKNFAQLFVYKEEIDEESEMEMEIGYPTDVKHVTHIGLDGSANTNAVQGWDHLLGPELLSIKNANDSLKQFELSMAAQADHAPLVKAAT